MTQEQKHAVKTNTYLTLLPLTTRIRVAARRWHCWAIWSYQHTAHNLPCCNKKILHQHLLNMHTTVHIILNVWCCAYEKKRNMGQISFCVTFVSLSFLLFCSPFVFFIYIEHDSSPFFYEFSVFEKKKPIPFAVICSKKCAVLLASMEENVKWHHWGILSLVTDRRQMQEILPVLSVVVKKKNKNKNKDHCIFHLWSFSVVFSHAWANRNWGDGNEPSNYCLT